MMNLPTPKVFSRCNRLSISRVSIVGLAWGGMLLVGCQTKLPEPSDIVPTEVKALIEQRQACRNLAPSIPACDNRVMAQQFRQMREKYLHNPAVIALLDGHADFD